LRGGDLGRVRKVPERSLVRRAHGTVGDYDGPALYKDLKALRRMWAGELVGEDGRSVATTVTVGEEWHIPVADLEAAKTHGWQVAWPDAYPSILHQGRGVNTRPPLAWELELVEGCLRVVPAFVARHQHDDPALWSWCFRGSAKRGNREGGNRAGC
jgi:hypothetical protein